MEQLNCYDQSRCREDIFLTKPREDIFSTSCGQSSNTTARSGTILRYILVRGRYLLIVPQNIVIATDIKYTSGNSTDYKNI